MPVVRAGAAGVLTPALATQQAFTLPSGGQQGDLIIIWLVASENSNSFSSPFFNSSGPVAGAGGAGTIQTLYKPHTGDLPGTQYTVTAANSDAWGGIICCVGNQDQSLQFDDQAIGPIQTASATSTPGTTAALTVTLPQPTTQGTCLVAALAPSTQTLNNVSPADNWALAKLVTDGAGNNYYMFTDQNGVGGRTSFTFNLSAAASVTCRIYEFPGVVTSSAVDQTQGATGASQSSWSSNSTGTTLSNEIAIGMCAMFASTTPAITPSVVYVNELDQWGGSGSLISGWGVISTPTTVAYSGTNTPAYNEAGAIVITLKLQQPAPALRPAVPPAGVITPAPAIELLSNALYLSYPGDLLLFFGMTLLPTGTSAITTPSGFSLVVPQVTGTIPSATNVSLMMASSTQAINGATGLIATAQQNSSINGSLLLAFPNQSPGWGAAPSARRRTLQRWLPPARLHRRRVYSGYGNTGTQFPLFTRPRQWPSTRVWARITRNRIFAPTPVPPAPFTGWRFTTAGTPVGDYFTLAQGDFPPVAAGQYFYDTNNPGIPFLITWISPPGFGFINANFTPHAPVPMNSGDIVTQANFGPSTLWPTVTQSVRKPQSMQAQLSRMVRRSRVIAPANLPQGPQAPLWTPPTGNKRASWRRFAPLLRRGKVFAPVPKQAAQGTPAIMTAQKQHPPPRSAAIKQPHRRTFSPPITQGPLPVGNPAMMPARAKRRPWAIRKLNIKSRTAGVPIPKRTQQATVHLTAPTTLTAGAHATHVPVVALSQRTVLHATATRLRFTTVALQAHTVLKALASVTHPATAHLTANTVLTATAHKTRLGHVALTASTTLTATATRSRGVNLTQGTRLTVAVTVTHPVTVALAAPTVLTANATSKLRTEEILIAPLAVPGVNEPPLNPPVTSAQPVTEATITASIREDLYDS